MDVGEPSWASKRFSSKATMAVGHNNGYANLGGLSGLFVSKSAIWRKPE